MSHRRTHHNKNDSSPNVMARIALGLLADAKKYRGDVAAMQEALRDFVPSSTGQAEERHRQITDKIQDGAHRLEACRGLVAQALNRNNWKAIRFFGKVGDQFSAVIRDLQRMRALFKHSIKSRRWPVRGIAA